MSRNPIAGKRFDMWSLVTLMVLALYGISRFLVDLSRWYEPEQVMALGWSNNQWLSAGLVLAGIAVLVVAARGRERAETT